jgi:hypothetical protein
MRFYGAAASPIGDVKDKAVKTLDWLCQMNNL